LPVAAGFFAARSFIAARTRALTPPLVSCC
jgi:hypothetical protein